MKKNTYIRLLNNRGFLSFWTSTTLLRFASNVLQFALAVYVLDLTGSGFIYSSVLAIIIVPRFLCSAVAGYHADYKDNIRTLRIGSFGLTGLMAFFNDKNECRTNKARTVLAMAILLGLILFLPWQWCDYVIRKDLYNHSCNGIVDSYHHNHEYCNFN